jgi:RimJ/RimL family protein N-acetyltransferase
MTSTRDIAAAAASVMTGPLLRLRPLEDTELSTIESWWNAPETLPFQTAGLPPRPAGHSVEQFKEWYANGDPGSVGFAVVRREDDALLGAMNLFGITAPGQCATFGVMLGPPAQGRGYGIEATRLMVDYGFRMLPLHRIQLGVWSYNDRARTVYERAGFREEGRRREVLYVDGAWHDEVLMGILRTEWVPTDWHSQPTLSQ